MAKAKPRAAKAKPPTRAKKIARPKRAGTSKSIKTDRTLLLVATRKGAWIYRGDAARKDWRTDGPHFLGQIINHLVLDPRDGRTLLAAASTGHLGPTIFRSTDFGKSWKEAKRPPAFPKAANGKGRSVNHTFWLTPAHASEPGVWYAGTSPQGLFRSEDGGVTWDAVFRPQRRSAIPRMDGRARRTARPTGRSCIRSLSIRATPSICISACRAAACMNRATAADSWTPLIEGMEVVEGFDRQATSPSTIRIACGCARPIPTGCISRTIAASTGSTGRSKRWTRIGKAMPERSAISAFPWWCIRATTRRAGCFRWTADGVAAHQPGRQARRLSSRAMAARAGSGWTRACPSAMPGGR